VLKKEDWPSAAGQFKHNLADKVFGGFPRKTPLNLQVSAAGDAGVRTLTFEPEPGLQLTAIYQPGSAESTKTAILLDLDGTGQAGQQQLTGRLYAAGWNLLRCDLRATGRWGVKGDQIGSAVDHNSSEWALWIGRPLIAQWTWDALRLIDALHEAALKPISELAVVGYSQAALVGIAAGIFDPRVTRVVTVNGLTTYWPRGPYVRQRLGIMAPGMIKFAGDVPVLASLMAPRKLVLAGGLAADGVPVEGDALQEAYAGTRRIYELLDVKDQLQVLSPSALLDQVADW
jgi:hypothetical protein